MNIPDGGGQSLWLWCDGGDGDDLWVPTTARGEGGGRAGPTPPSRRRWARPHPETDDEIVPAGHRTARPTISTPDNIPDAN